MKDKVSLKKKIIPYLLVLCIAMLAELFIFNFRSYESLGYEEKLLSEFDTFVDNDENAGIASLYINTGGVIMHNVFLNMALVDPVSGSKEEGKAVILVKESGNSSLREVTEKVIRPDHPADQYIFWKSKGEIEQIRIDFPVQEGKSLRIYEIKLNAHRPLFFSFIRFLVLSVAGVVAAVVCKALMVRKDKEQGTDETGKERDESCL